MTISAKCALAEVFRNLGRVSSVKLSKMHLCDSDSSLYYVNTVSSCDDLVKLETRSFSQTFLLDTKTNCLSSVGSRVPAVSFKEVVYSTDGTISAAHSTNKTEDVETDFIELFNSKGQPVDVFNVSLQKKHDKIVNSAALTGVGGMSISPNKQCLAYVANRKKPEKFQHYGKEDVENGVNEYLSKDDYGEKLDGVDNTVVCILNFKSGSVAVLDHLDDKCSYFCPAWLSDDQLVLIGYTPIPFRLGLAACVNRPCQIFSTSISTKEIINISTKLPNKCFYTLSLSPDGKQVITASNPVMGPHLQYMDIVSIDVSTHEFKILTSAAINSIPKQPWLDEFRFCFNVFDKVNIKAMVLDIVSNKVIPLVQFQKGSGVKKFNSIGGASHKVADISDGLCAVLTSSFMSSEELIVVTKNGEIVVTAENDSVVYQVPCYRELFDFDSWGYYFVGPIDQSCQHPCLLFIHGGPHVSLVDYAVEEITFFVKMGFNVVIVNYTGSLGFTNESLNSLPGNVGTVDVKDCYTALQAALDSKTFNCDRSKVAVMGGSHGGFLSLHMIGQYPDVFHACSVRNPVTNLGSMFCLTDIPDWTVCEVSKDCNFDFKLSSDPDFYLKAFKMSPVNYIKNVRTPTQFHLGLKDRRVPPSQTREYYRELVSHGKAECCLFEYPEDNHSLRKVKSEANLGLETYSWFCKHMSLN